MKNEIIIHCSDSEFGNAALITKWHVVDNGWLNVGYHFVILNGRISSEYTHPSFDGLIETGRAMNTPGAHTKGHNDSIGICLIGKSGKFTPNQLLALKNQIRHIRNIIGPCEIRQHSDYEPAKPYCAGLSKEFIEELKIS